MAFRGSVAGKVSNGRPCKIGSPARSHLRSPALLLVGAAALCGCAGKSSISPRPPSSTASAPVSPSNPASPSPSQSASPSTTASKTIVFANVTLHTPPNWDIDIEGDTAYVGVLAGGPADVNLRITRNFSSPIDSLRPTTCNDAPEERPTSVETVETGFRSVGDRTAAFRLWRAVCRKGPEEHRAWVLPQSRLAFYEQVHETHPENVDVVSTAQLH